MGGAGSIVGSSGASPSTPGDEGRRTAAASAVVLLITVLLMIGIMMRFVNIRKEL